MSTLRNDWPEYIYDRVNKFTSVKYYYSEAIHPLKDFHFKIDKKWVPLRNYWLVFCKSAVKNAYVMKKPEQIFQIQKDSVMTESYTHCLFIQKDDHTDADLGGLLHFIFSAHSRVKDAIFHEDFLKFSETFGKFTLFLTPSGRVEMHFMEKEVNTGHPLKDNLVKIGKFAETLLDGVPIHELYPVSTLTDAEGLESTTRLDNVLYCSKMFIVFEPTRSAFNIFFLRDGAVTRYRKSTTVGKTRVISTDINIAGDCLGDIDKNTKFDSMKIGEVLAYVSAWNAMKFAI
jgi:hypothetical protein